VLFFLKTIGSGTHRVTQNSVREGGVLVISMPGKKFWNAVTVCALLRKNFRKGVPAHFVTIINLDLLFTD
jgi:hypothetical protein